MATTISYSGGTILPDTVSGYESVRDGGNIVHPILGRTNPDVTLRPSQLRSGTLTLVFGSESASKIAEDASASGVVFSLTSDRASIAMSYVVRSGGIRRSLAASGGAWVLELPFQEVSV